MELTPDDVAKCILICGLKPTCTRLRLPEEVGLTYLRDLLMQDEHPLLLKRLCEEVIAACFILGIEKASQIYKFSEATLEEIILE